MPARERRARTRLQELEGEERTLVFYESPHRLAETLHDCAEIFGAERSAVVARELTKMHECVYRGTLAALVVQARRKRISRAARSCY